MKRKFVDRSTVAWIARRAASSVGTKDRESAGVDIGQRICYHKPIRGDKGISNEIQPHLNSGLWAVYLEDTRMNEMKPTPPEEIGPREAPGARPKPPIPS